MHGTSRYLTITKTALPASQNGTGLGLYLRSWPSSYIRDLFDLVYLKYFILMSFQMNEEQKILHPINT